MYCFVCDLCGIIVFTAENLYLLIKIMGIFRNLCRRCKSVWVFFFVWVGFVGFVLYKEHFWEAGKKS